MKRLSQFLIVLFVLIGQATAQFDGIKIMINPGHGGNDSDDRFIATTGFWESEGNLTKGLHLRDLLEARGAEIIMSRVENRTEDDLPLSQISGIANSNNVDFFHSIHSNAANANANSTLMLYKEIPNTGQPAFEDARRMGNIMGPELNHTNYTTGWSNRGDWSFYGSFRDPFNLGVLKDLIMPGTLSEGSFHDYRQESWRLMNLDYRKHEAVAILRSFLEYFELPDLEYGAIAGLSRDISSQVNYGFNSSLPNDKYVTINNSKVYLYSDSVLLKTYNGDFNNNGYFVFDSVDPGTYKLIFEYGQFDTDTAQVIVIANKTTFLERFPQRNSNLAPQVFSTVPEDGKQAVNTYTEIEITFSRSMNTGSVLNAFSILPNRSGTFSWSKSNTVLKFSPDTALNVSTEYQITIDTTAMSNNGIKIETVFSSNFISANQHIYPEIIATLPAMGDSIAIDKNVRFTFNQEMIPVEVEKAFSILPEINGSFLWDLENSQVTFDPNEKLIADTLYTITIADSALNSFYVGLEDDFLFSFKTRKRNSINVLASFPAESDTGISILPEFFFLFDGLINGNTVIGNAQLWDDVGNQYPVKSQKIESRGLQGVFRFEPRFELERNKSYTITLLPEIRDIDDLPLEDSVFVNFTTSIQNYISGSILDDFNSGTGWQDPNDSPSTMGTDPDQTTFGLSALEKLSGATSGKLVYTFTSDSGGICRVSRLDPYPFNRSSGSKFGLWVYGDYSLNTLELWFDVGSQTDQIIVLDTLNFSGWKLLQFNTDELPIGSPAFHSVVVRQQKNGYPESIIFVEDAQYDVITALENNSDIVSVNSFSLKQNYPNPFNPATKIEYALPEAAEIELNIYNALGQQVADLKQGKKEAGTHIAQWQASNFASGVYYYRLKAITVSGKTFNATRKLLLLK